MMMWFWNAAVFISSIAFVYISNCDWYRVQRVSESVYKKNYVWRKQKLGDSSSDQVSGVAACKQRKNGTIMPWNMTCIYNSEQPLLKLELLLIG